jgi:hypothetical protein
MSDGSRGRLEDVSGERCRRWNGHGLEGDDISSTECDMSGVCEAGSIGSRSLLVRKTRLFPGGLELGELARDLLTDLPLFPALQCLLHALE